MKLNKITVIEIIVAFIVLVSFGIYFAPKFLNKKENTIMSKVKANDAVFTSKMLEEFAIKPMPKPSLACQRVVDLLNKTEKNPYNKTQSAFSFDLNCNECMAVEYDDNFSIVILTTYDKEHSLVSRTVINPPSYVTYYKEDGKTAK